MIFACCALALMAQDAIRVNYKGNKPTISDFAWAFLSDNDDDECGDEPVKAFKEAWVCHRKGLPQEEGVTLTVDEKNGYVLYEQKYGTVVHRMEMCYWNEADGKHKLFAFNNMATVDNGKPVFTETSDLIFYRYNNATKKMTYCKDAPGFDVDYGCSYALPRTGKDILVTKWKDNGKSTQKKLKWNGKRFSH